MEKYLDLGFMLFGIAFFIVACNHVRQDNNVEYNRKLSEAREFGFEGSKLQKEAQNTKKR